MICLSWCALAGAQPETPYFADDPCLTPDGEVIVFSFEGDLWKVPAEGGEAVRITAMEGLESRPHVSPDGRWLAFTGTQYGNEDVFIIPVEGGAIRQLTFHEADDKVANWSWDNESVFFTSDRYNRVSSYAVPVKGGTPRRLFDHYFNTVHNPAEHPRTGEIFFNETWESYNFVHRKGYKGAFNPDIKSYNPRTGEYKVYTDHVGKDFGASIDRQGNIYYLSDEYNGEYNLYVLDRGRIKRLTDFASAIWNPCVSADGSRVVFRRDYQLWSYDVRRGRATRVPVTVVRNSTLEKTRDFKVQGNITAFDVSADGKKLAFVSRGELFVSDIKGRFVRQISARPGSRVLEVYWLKDDRTLLFNQTVAGYQNWFTVQADGSGEEKQLTNDRANNRLAAFNSDKTRAVYLSGREELRLLDLETMQSRLLLREEFWGFYNDQPQWAPDDRHLVFTVYRDFERDIFLLDTESGESGNLTQTGVTETTPAWSPDGKYLYFVSNRTRPSYPFGLRDSRVYRLPLEKYDDPYRADKFTDLFKAEVKKDSTTGSNAKTETKKEKPVIRIDYDHLPDRLERIGPSFGTQNDVYVIQKDEKTTVLYVSDHDEGKDAIWKTVFEPFEKPRTEKIKGADTGDLNIATAKDKYYLLIGGDIHNLDVDAGKTEKIDISYTFRRSLRAEFEQMFEETWANMEENFYDETFHGVDWPAMRDRYAAYLPFVSNRADLRRLLNDLLGELNTSHFGFSSSGDEEKAFYGTRSMAAGILFSDTDPYRVGRIIRRGPADRKDKDIRPGDRLVAVNGRPVDPAMNREYYFAQPSLDEEMQLSFRRDTATIRVMIHPIPYAAQRNLLYEEWIDDCQRRVDEKTGRRVAYVHMKNMGTGELQTFLEDMVAEWHQRKALILDLRYNTGGNVHDEVLRFLAQRPYLQWKYRGGRLAPQPNFGPAAGPIVLLINEQTLSDAEMTATGFKELKLGTVIGTETYRWIIFTSGKSLVDGSFYRLPSWGCYTLDGKDIEKTGVAPDIFVKNTFKDRLDGKDPQLDRAISELVKALDRKD